MTQVQYNDHERRSFAFYDDMVTKRNADPNSVSLKELREAREQVDLLKENARLRTERLAKLEAERNAQREALADAEEAQRLQQAKAEIAQFKAESRSRYPGSDAEFEREWTHILAEWKRQRALGGPVDTAVERARRDLRDLSPDRYGQL